MTGVLLLAAIGLYMSVFTTASLMTGAGTMWTGVAIAALGTALALFLGAPTWVRVIAAVCLVLGLVSTLWVENELNQKRTEISNIFNNGS